MKASIQDQIHDYADDVISQSMTVDLDEITDGRFIAEPVRSLRSPVHPAKLRSSPWLVAAATAVAVLVLVGGVASFVRTSDSETPVAATPSAVTSSLTWTRVPYSDDTFGDGFEQGMSGVTVGGPGFVAVGQSGPDEDYQGRAAVWTSVDGATWSRVIHNDAAFNGSVMRSVVAGGPGLVAVGTSDQGTVWTSPDGFVWSRVPANEAVFGGTDGRYVSMNSVTTGGPGLVAVGIEGHPHSLNVQAVVWTSPDGINWSRVPHDDAVFGKSEDGYHTQMQSVTVGGPGLVAVGGAWSGLYDPEVAEDDPESVVGGAAVWTSVDGTSWSRVPNDEGVFSGSDMSSVTAGGSNLVAVGDSAWTSPDGINWTQVPHDNTVFGGATMHSVTTGGPGLVAVGWDDHPQDARVVIAVAFTSVDGTTWSQVPHDDAVFGATSPGLPVLEMWSITADGTRLVAVGSNGVHPTFGATRSDAVVWVADWE